MAVLGLAAWSANHFAIEAFNENGVSRPSDVARAP
jgi:hypothetical protein